MGEPALTLAASAVCALRKAVASSRLDDNNLEKFVINTPATPSLVRNLCTDKFVSKVAKEEAEQNDQDNKLWCIRV